MISLAKYNHAGVTGESLKSLWKQVLDYYSAPHAAEPCKEAQREEEPGLKSYEEAPTFLQQNPFIRTGYRCNLELRRCFRSMFQWNNETLNIWTHLAGFLIILGLLVHDLLFRLDDARPSPMDRFYCVALCATYMTTLLLSVVYHTFNCHSEHSYNCLLKWDVLGVALSLSVTFISGVHYAFACRADLETIYNGIEVSMVVIVLVLNFAPKFSGPEYEKARLVVLSSLVIFGLVPTAHWFSLNGGFAAPIVQLLLPRIAVMFLYMGVAFTVYKYRIPECFFPGRMDHLGSSHQIWHVVVFLSLVWWHETSFAYFNYMKDKECAIPVDLLDAAP
ncbi:progestin and adipoQ receptor family member 3 [Ixodes scapularis]